MGKDASSPPPAPDYTTAAKETAQGNLQAARYATRANRVNTYTPYGNLTYTQGGGGQVFNQDAYDKALSDWQGGQSNTNYDPSQWRKTGDSAWYNDNTRQVSYTDPALGTSANAGSKPNPADYYTSTGNPDQWSASVNLSPDQQALLDQQTALSKGLFGAQNSSLGQVNAQGPMDLSSVQGIADKAYGLYKSRLDPEWQQNQNAIDAKLANQGITPGSQAYDNAMRSFYQGKNDAYNQANIASINTMPQTYSLALSQYNQPLNRLNALRTGSQVTNPNFPNVPQQQTTTGANLLGAAQGQYQGNLNAYNANVGQQNSMMNGLFSLGSAAMPLIFG